MSWGRSVFELFLGCLRAMARQPFPEWTRDPVDKPADLPVYNRAQRRARARRHR